MKRIGILTHNYPQTTADRKDAGIFIYDFAHELAKKTKVFVFCPNFVGKKEAYRTVSVTWFNWLGGEEKFGDWNIFNPLSLLKFINLIQSGRREVLQFIKKNKIDFCLACWAFPSGVFAWEAKRKLGVPYATWSLGSDINRYLRYPFLRQIIIRVIKEADWRFANSFLLCRKIESFIGEDCQFMPAVTDFEIKGIRPPRRRGDKFRFLFVGRLGKVKGPDILLKACRLLKKKSPDFEVSVLGDGTMLPALKKKVISSGLEKKASFYGKADKEEVIKFMLSSDVLVIPSRSESLPLVLLEAAKAGLPVLASNVGDCPRLIRDYNIGHVVEREDPEKLARKMYQFMEQKKSLKKKYQEGLKKIAREFNQPKAVEILLKTIGGE